MKDITKFNKSANLSSRFANRAIQKSALTEVTKNNLGAFEQIKEETADNIASLAPQDNIQILLASQMISIHELQQKMMMYVTNSGDTDITIKYINAASKLSNIFIQQVSLLSKLQGSSEQKMTVEHVHIHNGAQAVVGTIHSSSPTPHEKEY